MIPASTQKLLVAAVALEVLGPEYRFTTAVASPAPIDGEVTGDVYLIGGGDPLLTSDDYPIADDLPSLAHADQRRDIKHARGLGKGLLPVQLDALPAHTGQVEDVRGVHIASVKVKMAQGTALGVDPARGREDRAPTEEK